MVLLSYFLLWQGFSNDCCKNEHDFQDIYSVGSDQSSCALSFCYGSSELLLSKFVNNFIDSVKERIENGWDLKITALVDSTEYYSNENLGIQRAENLLRFFKSLDSNVHITYDIEIVGSIYYNFDSCSKLFNLEFISLKNSILNDSFLILQHIDGIQDLIITESSIDKLDKLIIRMKQKSELVQVITFLKDSSYSKDDFKLARSRGKVIKNYLVESGADSKNIQLQNMLLSSYNTQHPLINLQLNQSLIKFIK